jgi:hypothetical protein
MRKIAKFFLITIFATLLFAGRASAVNNPKLSDNPDSPQSIEIRRTITGAKEPVTNTFEYEIYETKNTNLVRDIPTDIRLEFDEAEPDEDGVVEQSATIDLSNMSFKGVGGIRYLAIREVSSSDSEDYPLSSQIYYFRVAMAGETDAAGWQTGHFTPTLMLPFEDEGGAKYETAEFAANYDDTRMHIRIVASEEVEHPTEGDVYHYIVTVHGREGEVYTVYAPDTEYDFNGELVTSDTECVAGEPCHIYLYRDEFATIGEGRDGENDQLRLSTTYDLEFELSSKYVEPEPVKPIVPKTGIAVQIIPFIILAVIAIIGIAALRATPREK